MKESGIISAVMHYLQYLENQGKCVFIRNNSGAFINPRGQFYKMGRAGSPDFLIFIPNKTIHLEIKNERGKQAMTQLDYELKITKLNHIYEVARSVDDVKAILSKYL